MTEEIWKPIKGYENYYEVSNLGRVKSLRNNLIMKLTPSGKKGYLGIILRVNGTKKSFRINRLVAETFIPNPNNLPEVNHKDYDKTNNCVDNLEWCTHEYNMMDMFKHYGIEVKAERYCVDCGKKISNRRSNRCNSCSMKNQYNIGTRERKVNIEDRPNREKLKYLIRNNPMLTIGKMFGVSDNAVRKWCKKYYLPYKSTEIKKYTDKEWASI